MQPGHRLGIAGMVVSYDVGSICQDSRDPWIVCGRMQRCGCCSCGNGTGVGTVCTTGDADHGNTRLHSAVRVHGGRQCRGEVGSKRVYAVQPDAVRAGCHDHGRDPVLLLPAACDTDDTGPGRLQGPLPVPRAVSRHTSRTAARSFIEGISYNCSKISIDIFFTIVSSVKVIRKFSYRSRLNRNATVF